MPHESGTPPTGDAGLQLEDERNTIEIYQRFRSSVVAVNVQVQGRSVSPFEGTPFDDIPEFFREFVPSPQAPERGAGSGFVADDQGHILTNYHVIAAALRRGTTEFVEGANIEVVFSNEERGFPARVIGATALYDLALLELTGESVPDAMRNAKPIEFADSDQIRVGQKTIAIGNPFGFASTVTTGIVSGVGRSLPGVGQVEIPLVQTDAAINPGNSGGPLLDSRGRLLGVNTAIIPGGGGFGGMRGFLGLGFAVPANLVRQSLPALIKGGISDITTRARIGVAILDLREYPDEVRQSLDLPEEGVAIVSVEPGSPAAEAGLRGARFQVQAEDRTYPGGMDIIVSVDGEKVDSARELQQRVLAHEAGETVTVGVLRDGEVREEKLTLEVIPARNQPQQP